MQILVFVLLLIAVILFVLDALTIAAGRVRLLAVGLAFLSAAFLVRAWP